ncbi:hypothetical protein ACHHYP_00724 [Achlya hypogyna]|uniref:Transmembrane protein 198 n=1 Tax=Achlya hypogyna TaxID=1202772 RepID=A0A1V9ZU18_ACHHY|nr:hypothetical protein ACHHYP_00724 [Achlya hypogyna]
MFLSSYPDEPLLGPASMRKRVQGPNSSCMRPKARRLLHVTVSVLGCIVVSIFLLGLIEPSTRGVNLLSASDSQAAAVRSSSPISTIAPAVVYGVATAVGLTLGLVGYRFMQLAVFCAGFAIGLVLGFNAGYVGFEHETFVFSASLAIGVIAAIFLGTTAVFLFRFGILVLGVFAGVALGAFIGALFLMRLYPAHPEVPVLIAMAVFGFTTGLAAYLQERLVVILCTAFLGGYFFVLGVGNLVGNYPSPSSIAAFLDGLRAGKPYDMPGIWWAYFAATLVAWLTFAALQFHYTTTPSIESVRRPPRPAATDADNFTSLTSPKGSGPTRASFHVERGI